MKTAFFKLGLSVTLGLLLATGSVLASSGISERGVVPTAYPGNFVASDDQQVCFEMADQGYIGDFTTDVRGFKIDPPMDYHDGCVDITISPDGRQLAWEACAGAEMLGIIVKGGPNYNVYDYVGTGYLWDAKLQSPLHRRNVPAISHYNICYVPPQNGGAEGCTPGYWRNHADRWLGVAPSDSFNDTFGVELFDPDITLGTAIWLGGGGLNALARHATAALLNAYGGVPNGDGTYVNYPYTLDYVILAVQAAAADPDLVESTKDQLDAANNLGCPLSGTPRVKVE